MDQERKPYARYDITPRFKRALKRYKNSKREREAISDAIRELAAGPPFPNGLRVHPIEKAKSQGVKEASPTMAIRITFEVNDDNVLILRNVGPHDITLENP